MADTIQITYKVMEDGSLKAIGKDAEKAAQSTDKATKSADRYSKKNKGVAQATSNSTKAFSKMTAGISGGLVPAYATLAANAFALSAAFGLLSRNDAISKLQEGLEFTGRSAGRNLTLVADKLREITDNAISTEQAMRTTAVGISAGFSESQMEGLAKVAKGASLALGRDLGDAMDRLTRGAAKLEPEILDELGIMVRLDKATKDYANSLNKNVTSLTMFERRMAFTNAIIADGTAKYDQLADALDASPYSKLSATFSDLTKDVIEFVQKGLRPVINFLAESKVALLGVGAAFLSSIGGTMIGGLAGLAKASAEASSEQAKLAANSLKAIKPMENLPPAFNRLAKAGKFGDTQIKSMTKSLNMSINMMNKTNPALGKVTAMRNALNMALWQGTLASDKLNLSNSLNILMEQGVTAAIGHHILGLKGLAANTLLATAGQSFYNGTLIVTQGLFLALTSSAKLLFAITLKVMPYIALIGMAVSMLYPVIEKMFGLEDSRLEQQVKKNAERFEEFTEVIELYTKTIKKASGASSRWYNTARPLAGILTEVNSAIVDAGIIEEVERIKGLTQATTKLKQAQADRGESTDKNDVGLIRARGQAVASATEAVEKFKNISEEAAQTLKDNFVTSVSTLIAKTKIMETALQSNKKTVEENADSQALLTHTITKAQAIMEQFSTDGNIKKAQTDLNALSISTNSAVQSFEKFNDLIAEANTLLSSGDGNFGPLADRISNVNSALTEVNSILLNGKGQDTANKKANEFLKVYGIEGGGQSRFIDLADDLEKYRDGMNKLAKDQATLNATSPNMSAIAGLGSESNLLDTELKLAKDRVNLEKVGTQEKHDAEIAVLEILAKQADMVEKMTKAQSDRNKRLGGEGFAAARFAVDSAGDFSEKREIAHQAAKQKDPNAEIPALTGSQVFSQLSETAGPMMEQLASLGPEGALMSSVMEGALNMGEAFTSAFESIEAGGSKAQAGVEMAAAAINSISQIMAAQSTAKIASIDKEIAAEKKRDGQSAGSVSKLKALEKKKEQMKRKEFEQNKKMQMAQVVANTASAIMGLWSGIKDPYVGPTLAAAQMAVVGALGAAQLATIAKTSYDGGGSSINAGGVSKIGMGERKNTVDLAKGGSQAGELSYMRGASGIGGMQNFTPAFSGYRNRAAGGGTGFMVGEQGPETFIPSVPGTILPADETTSASNTNVTFTINAVDSAGVEELLINQRGNLIRMIREAANEQGEYFLEGVSETQL